MQIDDISVMIIISTLVILLLLAAAVITIVLSNRRHVQQEIKYERELRLAEQEVREQVLANVGRELHDNIGQLLTVMHMQLEQERIMNPASLATIAPVGETLAQAIQEVRRVGKSLNSDLMENNGLINTMQNEVVRLRKLNKYEITWEHDAEPVLAKDQKIIAFRIFQEIINNALKHSQAKHINIALQGGNIFKLTVSDDGRGFDIDAMLQSAAGSGLKNMMMRAEIAKLKCDIKSGVNKGTSFTVKAA